MERYTALQVQRALAGEQLLRRLDQGDDFEVVCQELGLSLNRNYVSELRRRYRQGGSTWEALIDHRHGRPYKLSAERRSWLRERKRENPAYTQQQLASLYEAEFDETLSQVHVGNVLRGEGVAIPGGQHYWLRGTQALPVDKAGVFFPPSRCFADGRAQYSYPGHPGPQSSLPGA